MFGYTLATLPSDILSKRWLGNLHPHNSVEGNKFELLTFCCLSCFKVFGGKPKIRVWRHHTLEEKFSFQWDFGHEGHTAWHQGVSGVRQVREVS